jgi:hypothetical protein
MNIENEACAAFSTHFEGRGVAMAGRLRSLDGSLL